MVWIESHQELARHPKTKRLARLLEISLPAAIGHLHLLWWWAMSYAKDGALSKYDAADLADAVLWDGEPDELVHALIAAGFLEADLSIHDWDEYAGRLLEKQREDARRKRDARASSKDVPQTSGGHPPDIQRTAQVPDLTGPDRTGPDLPGGAPAAAAPADEPPLQRPKLTIHEPPGDAPPTKLRPVPKPAGPALGPLVDAFRALGLPEPDLSRGEGKAAQELLGRAPPEQLAECWRDHRSGEYGDDFSRRDLSFDYLGKRNRFENWKAWKAGGSRNGQRPERGTTRISHI